MIMMIIVITNNNGLITAFLLCGSNLLSVCYVLSYPTQ